MPKRYVILTAVGSDQPGVVRQVSAIIHSSGCNIEDSRMAILAGEFALILLFSGPPAAVQQAQHETGQILRNTLGFVVSYKETTPPDQQLQDRPATRQLSVSGSDQPGIVHRVSEALAEQGINVASFESHLGHAAFSGTPIFRLNAELQIPNEAVMQQLEGRLEQVCDELNLTYSLEP